MRRLLTLPLLGALGALALGGCLDARSGGLAATSDADASGADAQDALGPDDVRDVVDALDRPEALPWCQPRARSGAPAVELPEVPAEVLTECGLREVVVESLGGRTRRTTYVRDGDVLWAGLSDYEGDGHLLRVDFAAGVRVAAEYGLRAPGGGLRFAVGAVRDRVRWDVAGHLLEVARVDDGGAQVTLAQTWDGDRLVARRELRDGWAGSEPVHLELRTAWAYDAAGRLTGATVTGVGPGYAVVVSRDDAGRVSSVERRRGEVVVERLAWSFDAGGQLAARTVLYDRSADTDDGWSPSGLDDLGVADVRGWLANPWPSSLVQASEAGDCLVLPHTVGHGYPEGEHEYDLGMPRDERPNGVGFAYGADIYAWNYGDLAWYSHTGVAGLAPEFVNSRRYEASMAYEGGRMVRERGTDTGDVVATRDRTRSFDGDGHLEVDRLELTLTYPRSAERPETRVALRRDMAFAWAGGQLVRRELRDDDHGLLERQTWTWDAAGRWASHEVGEPSPLTHISPWSPPTAVCGEAGVVCGEPAPWRRYEQERDAVGRQTALRVLWLDSPANVDERRFVYDDAGRLVEARQGGGVERWTYDDAGHEVLMTQDTSDDGVIDYRSETDWDGAGRWVERRSYAGERLVQTERRTFACE